MLLLPQNCRGGLESAVSFFLLYSGLPVISLRSCYVVIFLFYISICVFSLFRFLYFIECEYHA